jgi:hypothetical protein
LSIAPSWLRNPWSLQIQAAGRAYTITLHSEYNRNALKFTLAAKEVTTERKNDTRKEG